MPTAMLYTELYINIQYIIFKVLRVGGQIIAAPSLARMLMLCGVFSNIEDALEFNLELVQDCLNYIMTANLTVSVSEIWLLEGGFSL